MKLIPFLAASAFVGLAIFALSLAFSAHALGSYAAASSMLVVLGAVRDYSPRRSYWEPGRARTTRFPTAPARQEDRLAA